MVQAFDLVCENWVVAVVLELFLPHADNNNNVKSSL